jgi:CelD/BcsL family acetyltransferase involved in cellulose biosynthesis
LSSAPRDDVIVRRQTLAPPEWSTLLSCSLGADFFHTALWTETVCRHLPGTTPVWLSARAGGELLGGLVAIQRRRAGLPHFSSHFEGTSGGPLVRRDMPEEQGEQVFAILLEHYAALGHPAPRRAGFTLPASVETRFGGVAAGMDWRRTPVSAAVLPLSGGLDHVEMHVFKKNRRNERNRSLKCGCRSDVTTDLGVLAKYYPIYREAARGWGREPTPLVLLQDLLARGQGTVFLSTVHWRDEIIGGHLCFHYGERVTAWNGATAPGHKDKFPATLLVWTDIVESCRRGARQLDLGASGDIPSLARFKTLLGCDEEIRAHYEKAPWPLRLLVEARRLWRGCRRRRA